MCWDKDRFSKDYMGEFDVALEDIFTNGQTIQEASTVLLDIDSALANIIHSPSGTNSNLENRVARRAMPLAKSS